MFFKKKVIMSIVTIDEIIRHKHKNTKNKDGTDAKLPVKKHVAEIIPNVLWIGSLDGAYYEPFWRKHDIKAILNVSSLEPFMESIFKMLDYHIKYKTTTIDSPISDLPFDTTTNTVEKFFQMLFTAVNFIDEMITNVETPIIVHCHSGMNRSAACIAAYMIFHMNMTSEEAIDSIRIANDRRDIKVLTNADYVFALAYYNAYHNFRLHPNNQQMGFLCRQSIQLIERSCIKT